MPAYTSEQAQEFAWSLGGAALGIWQAKGLESRIMRAMFREWLMRDKPAEASGTTG